jgi:hypothetical protein
MKEEKEKEWVSANNSENREEKNGKATGRVSRPTRL